MQRPLATVVIGGLIVSTVLTLIVIPAFYRLVASTTVIWRNLRNRRRASALRTLLLVIGAMLLAGGVEAQEAVPRISLDEAVVTALQNSPRLKRAEGEIARQRAARGEVWDGGMTQVGYAWGQLNGEMRHDNELTVEQSLGSLLTPFYQNALVRTRISGSQSHRDMVRKEITAEVKRAWVECLAAMNIYRLALSNDSLGERLKASGELRYRQGDINQLEYRMMATLATDLHTQAMQAASDVSLAQRRLAWSCYQQTPLQPTDSVLSLPEPTLPLALSQAHLRYFEAQMREKRAQVKVEKSRFFPELSVGYALQKIAPLKGLDSWSVGVSFPVIFFPQRSRVRQARQEALMAGWEAEENRTQLSNKVDELRTQLKKQRETIDYFTSAALREADELHRNALTLYQESETGIAELIQSLNSARDIRRNYIESLRDYLILTIELELYTETLN